MIKKILAAVILILPLVLPAISCGTANNSGLTLIEQLGKKIFFDTNLSSSGTMSCGTCHGPAEGFTGPNEDVNVAGAAYLGAVDTRAGNRKPPTIAYAGDSPVLYYDEAQDVWIGGMFWDGRATGWTLGDPLAEQAQGPFLNPLEQNLPNAYSVCNMVAQSDYADLFKQVWGSDSLDFSKHDVAEIFDKIARSISAYEKSTEVSPFSSKYDAYLAGKATLTAQEALGLQLFEGKAGCSTCHPAPLFTDYSYANLGIPKNPDNPFYQMPAQYNPAGAAWIDLGLGDFLQSAGYPAEVYEPELGKQKVPTLRNVDLRPYPEFVKAYGHNGYFKSLEDMVHFLNTRDVRVWPSPEYAATVNNLALGNLKLTTDEEADIVAFLKTLSDGHSSTSSATTSTSSISSSTTAGQLAGSGQTLFATYCAKCHGSNGQGGAGPAVIGNSATLSRYHTAQGLLDFIDAAMPLDAPGSLSHTQNLQLLAFLLVQNNNMSSGTVFNEAVLATVILK